MQSGLFSSSDSWTTANTSAASSEVFKGFKNHMKMFANDDNRIVTIRRLKSLSTKNIKNYTTLGFVLTLFQQETTF